MTPYKIHRKNSITSSPLQKYPINQRENSEYHGSKPHYTGSDNSYTDRSHDKENIKNQKCMDKWSNKDK